jgi:uroporphyrinogen-III synthase
MAKKGALRGLGILITRPEPQAQLLAKQVELAGGRPIVFPTLIIHEPTDTQRARQSLEKVVSADWLFFISANAVHYAAKLLGERLALSPQTRIAAIGKATQEALQERGIAVDLTPPNASHSEALLSQIALQNMDQKKCMIIRGEGGRETLSQALKSVGAIVSYAEIYRRDCPNSDTSNLVSRWKKGKIDYVIASSGETLSNLITLLGEQNLNLLTQTTLLTISKRIEKMAHNAGIERVIISKQPYNETLIKTLIEQTD